MTVFAVPAAADIDVYVGQIEQGDRQIYRPGHGGTTINPDGRGRLTFGSPDLNLGLDFEVLNPAGITITQLGVWDDTVFGVQQLGSPHLLQVWNIDTQVKLAEIFTLPGTGELRGDYRYFDVGSRLHLGGGTRFSVTVYYPPGNVDSSGNSGKLGQDYEPRPIFNGGGGALDNIWITATRGARYGVGPVFPTRLDWGPPNRYHAGSFSYRVTPNPEPGTIVLLGSVLAAGYVLRRRRRRARLAA
ncbi:MAG: PEP-CTERM sorting domain-containing protein [Deltaproteobacteria bacterium]|nr:MAG: PEP-CTERM sorting domain-containing protein [Deltaproteobacteria bacterium]